jgi:SAM-dependent methyltransferase
MEEALKNIYRAANLNYLARLGINLGTLFYTVRGLPKFYRDLQEYKRMSSGDLRPIKINPRFDWYGEAGTASGMYFHQDLWAAKKIFEVDPDSHLDVGSKINGFISHLLVFTEVKYVDVRPLESELDNLQFIQSDATEMREFDDNSLDSVSSLNAAEHFGLGRYGDPLDPDGTKKFMKSLQRVLAPGGKLYFSVPIGEERIEFNAHRVFSPHTVLNTFDELELVSFAATIDGSLNRSVTPAELGNKTDGYDCGLFEFTK